MNHSGRPARAARLIGRVLAILALVAMTNAARAADKLDLRLDWSWWAGQTPFLVADEKGFYRDAGLEVSIQQGQGSKTTTIVVGSGKEPIGHVSLSTAAQSISSGVPIKAVAAIIQKGPIGLICDKSRNILKPEDVKGKKIGSTPSGSDAQILPAFLAANKIGQSDVTVVNMQGDAKFAAIMSGQVDCISGDGPFYAPQMEAKGKKANVILYADWGVPNLGFGIISSDEFLKTSPDVVRRFVAATLKGVEYTYANIPESVDIFLRRTDNTQPREFHIGVLEFYKGQLHTSATEGKPLGWMAESDWAGMVTALGTGGDKPASAYFTNDFLPKN